MSLVFHRFIGSINTVFLIINLKSEWINKRKIIIKIAKKGFSVGTIRAELADNNFKEEEKHLGQSFNISLKPSSETAPSDKTATPKSPKAKTTVINENENKQPENKSSTSTKTIKNKS